jgi:hypothetical protein
MNGEHVLGLTFLGAAIAGLLFVLGSLIDRGRRR